MKKIIALALAIALLLGCTLAIAEEAHPTPHISTFAKMKTFDNGQYITITLDKAVDKLFVRWHNAGGKIVPEELAVTEVNGAFEATALKNGHKYMPGTSQYYATWINNCALQARTQYGKVYGKQVATSELAANMTDVEFEAAVLEFATKFLGWEISVEKPGVVVIAGVEVPVAGKLEAVKTNFIQVVNANPGQEAYITLQGDWIVSYNRKGEIVKIAYNDGIY